jgi:hypothetical protein
MNRRRHSLFVLAQDWKPGPLKADSKRGGTEKDFRQ